MLSKLVENVIPVGNPAYNRMEDQSGSSSISISGGPVRGNNYLIDGVPITDATNRAIIIPSLEAVQEVKIQANTYDAEMARTGGGMFNTLMKSGTNAYHGSALRTFAPQRVGCQQLLQQCRRHPTEPDQPNDTWGASFGGTVRIPKLYNGKNKTFFYLAFEHYDDTQSASSFFAAPTALEKTGDFSKSFTKSGGLLTIYDPLSTGTRTPFSGNVIPASRSIRSAWRWPATFRRPIPRLPYYGDNDLTAPGRLPCRAAQYTGKLDEDFTTWWRASVSYLRYFSLEPGNTWYHHRVPVPTSGACSAAWTPHSSTTYSR